MTTREYRNAEGLLHRDNDLPAIYAYGGYKAWMVNGKRHREGGLPAVEWSDGGGKEWWVNGQRHRDGGLPAVENANGSKKWYVNGQCHRDGGLPAIERVEGDADGTKEWYVNGLLHRDGGLPAIECVDGSKQWWVNGQQHREGGLPAVEYPEGGDDYENEWWVNGRELSEEKSLKYFSFCQKMKEKILLRAQKKIYFWWIQICYDLDHPSGCGKKMAQRNLEEFETMMK